MSARGIGRILRLPLFVTAVADVLAAYAVASLLRDVPFDGRVMALLAGTSAGLYLFGMVENDLADLRRDRLLGLARPLVTGEVGVPTAAGLLAATFALAAGCSVMLRGSAMLLAIVTFAAVNLYNLAAKQGPTYVAMTVMGLCRFLNYSIGVAAAVGVPRQLEPVLFSLSGPLWIRHAGALFFATAVVTGYSISARNRYRVSTQPWSAAFVATAIAGFAMIAIGVQDASGRFMAPVARVFALLLLPALWPGGLWGPAGRSRQPHEYAPFVERMLYWLIALDAAFVCDAWLMA